MLLLVSLCICISVILAFLTVHDAVCGAGMVTPVVLVVLVVLVQPRGTRVERQSTHWVWLRLLLNGLII